MLVRGVSLFLVSMALLSGCATRVQMSFGADGEPLMDKGSTVFLITATLKNVYRTSFQPAMLIAHVEKAGANDAADRLNFAMDDRAKDESHAAERGNTYYLRMQLEAGQYNIVGFTSHARSFPISALFFTPLHASIESKEPGVYYLGHVAATVRERQGNEFKAGPSIPLVDQAIAGASGGTFDVEVLDRFAEDERAFRFKFRALEGVEIKKVLLPPFNRVAAQRWWQEN